MQKKAILITIAIIAGVAALAWLLSTRSGKKDLSPWQLVPPNALAVIETDKPRLLQQLNADSAGIATLLIGNDTSKTSPEPWLFSIQSLGNKTVTVALLRKTVRTPLELAKSIKEATSRERTFEGYTIIDILRNNQPWLSAAQVRGIWLISSSAIPIEEIIRNLKSENTRTFRNQHSNLFQLSNVKQDDGNLYINWPKFREITSRNQNIDPVLKSSNLTEAMMFDLRWSGNGNTLLLNGFATDSLQNKSILSIFRTQKPVAFGLRTRLPDHFNYFVHLGISNPTQWLVQRDEFIDTNAPKTVQLFDSLLTKTSFNTEEFFKAVDNEVAMVSLPSGQHIIVAELKEITRATSEFNKINAAHSKANQYSHESYSNETIHVLKNSTLSQTLFWPLTFDASEVYYSITDSNLLVIADGEQAIKDFIDGANGESVLSKSLEWNKFLESTLQESNVSFFVSSGGGELFGSLRQPEKFSMQFYPLEGDYNASAIIEFGKVSGKPTKPRGTRKGTDLSSPIVAGPWVVRNHNDKSTEFLVTDAANQLHLISKDQSVLWNFNLPGPVQGDIHQVDMLKNGKLQYLAVANGQIHVVDRLGRYLTGYPKTAPMNDVVFTSLIDYDKNRNYRLLLADASGKIIVCDMDGKPLEGWTAKTLPRGFGDAPRHFRIRQKDYYEATTVQGDMFLFSRRAEIIEGFPLSTNITPAGDVVSDGKNLIMVSNDGTLLQVSTSGKKVSENALFKRTPKASFKMVGANNDDDFIIMKVDQGFIAGFDASGKQLFEVNNPASDNLSYSLFHLSDNRNVVVVFDKDQNLFYAVDFAGKLLIPQPQQASGMPAVSYDPKSKTITFNVPDQNRLVKITANF